MNCPPEGLPFPAWASERMVAQHGAPHPPGTLLVQWLLGAQCSSLTVNSTAILLATVWQELCSGPLVILWDSLMSLPPSPAAALGLLLGSFFQNSILWIGQSPNREHLSQPRVEKTVLLALKMFKFARRWWRRPLISTCETEAEAGGSPSSRQASSTE